MQKVSIITAAIIIALVILDLLATRQILYLDNTSELILFTVTVVVGYGVGSWILLEYTRIITANIRAKSHLVNTLHWTVTISQFFLFGVLLFILYNNSVNCFDYISKCTNVRPQTTLVYLISSIVASVVMGIMSFKFFSWYKLNKRNFMVLFFALSAATFAIAIAEDAYTKLVFGHVVEEKSPPGAVPQASFIYETIEKYHGEIQYKVVNPITTTLWVLPSSLIDLKNSLDYLAVLPYIFTWLAVATLLRQYYKSIRPGAKFPVTFWIFLSVPLVLYLIGSGLIISLPADIPYRFYFRLIFRAGTIGSSVLFGLAFYFATRKLATVKVRDYLLICVIGIIPIGIANEISALQQTYGVAAHSLVLLSSYLFSIGLYSLAISISQDNSLRKSIRSSATKVANLLDILGTPQVEQEIERRVMTTAKEQQSVLVKKTGVEPSLTESDMKQYLGAVLKEIKILKNVEEILKKGKDILESSYEFFVCSGFGGLRLVYNNYFKVYEKITENYRKGEHAGIRLVTSVTDKESAVLVKKFLDIGVQIRHVNNMPPIDFALSDKEMIATIEKVEEESGETIKSLLVTNEQAYISHFLSIFDGLWINGIDAKERITAIEQGIEPEFLDVINDPQNVSKILIDLAKSVKKEALLILPNDKSMLRADRLGLIDYLIKASQEHGATIRIICPLSEQNSLIVSRILEKSPATKILNGNTTSAGMLIVDNAKFVRVELKDPIAEELIQSAGFTIYSNSKRSAESFRSIFELLWNERLLNEELKKTDTMQKEFINIAAHELRNPIQPIIGLSATLMGKRDGSITEYQEEIEAMNRNAKRLKRLAEDILDVAKIEGQSLNLNKSRFDLEQAILNTISDHKSQIKNHDDDGGAVAQGESKGVKLEFKSIENNTNHVFVYGDAGRITQVISNLLSNAIKFTDKGSITVKMEKKKSERENSSQEEEEVIVSIQDTGIGIDPNVKNKLFEKFAIKSEQGMGLGLYISRSIIEAHGGKIWAENNPNGKGATFSFSLPFTNLLVPKPSS